MRHKRELIWWAVICAAAVTLSTLVGGFLGPILALFVLVLLAGAILIEFEGPGAVPAAGDYLDGSVGEPADLEAETAAPVEVIDVGDQPASDAPSPEDIGDATDASDAADNNDADAPDDAESEVERAEEIEHRAAASA